MNPGQMLRSPMMSPMMSPSATLVPGYNPHSVRNGNTVGNSRPSMSQLLNEEFNKNHKRPDIGLKPTNFNTQANETINSSQLSNY